ncbi:hypothetical protein L484_027861 [Morus notabilis]|uniref:Uncharacterized protein n=1 Tax=Morus notabilis TaxID=981085 RepID=W9S7E5_9ROSA|nr:hypothetical protein L484_027861 [Morus notabilis]
MNTPNHMDHLISEMMQNDVRVQSKANKNTREVRLRAPPSQLCSSPSAPHAPRVPAVPHRISTLPLQPTAYRHVSRTSPSASSRMSYRSARQPRIQSEDATGLVHCRIPAPSPCTPRVALGEKNPALYSADSKEK